LKSVYFCIMVIMLGAVAAGFALYKYPEYQKSGIFLKNIQDAERYIASGEIKEGAAALGHAINVAGGMESLSAERKETIKLLLAKAARTDLMKSALPLDYLGDLGLDPGCNLRKVMHKDLVGYSYTMIYKKKEVYKSETPYMMGEALYLAALWAGGCEVEPKDLMLYREAFSLYQKEMGDHFKKADWMDAALAGKPVVGRVVKSVPVNASEPGVPAVAAGSPAPKEAQPPATVKPAAEEVKKKQSLKEAAALPGKLLRETKKIFQN